MRLFLLVFLTSQISGIPLKRSNFVRGRSYIIGGTDATQGEFPYILSFQENLYGYRFHFCAGSIYNRRTSISAAHCFIGEDYNDPHNLMVVAGDLNLGDHSKYEQRVKITKIVVHEDFDLNNNYNDIVLLKGKKRFHFDHNVGPVPVPAQGQNSSGTCTVIGWGSRDASLESVDDALQKSSSDTLQKADVMIVSDDDCRRTYGNEFISDSMICAGGNGTDACQGDSGGPLECDGYLAGIVSWGIGCADPVYPGVYTEVSYFVEWIKNNAWE